MRSTAVMACRLVMGAALVAGVMVAGAPDGVAQPPTTEVPPTSPGGTADDVPPKLTLSPATGRAPARVQVNVTCGASRAGPWTVRIVGGDGETDALAGPSALSGGSGTLRVVVPETAPEGSYEITAYCEHPGEDEFYAESDFFEVLPPSRTPRGGTVPSSTVPPVPPDRASPPEDPESGSGDAVPSGAVVGGLLAVLLAAVALRASRNRGGDGAQAPRGAAAAPSAQAEREWVEQHVRVIVRERGVAR